MIVDIRPAQTAITPFIRPYLKAATEDDNIQFKACLAGILAKTKPDHLTLLVKEIECESDFVFSLCYFCLPYNEETWRLLDDAGAQICGDYWKRVKPRLSLDGHTKEEINYSIEQLLGAGRADIAFSSIYLLWEKLETSILTKLLQTLISHPTKYSQSVTFDFSDAFDELDNRVDVAVDEKAALEFAYLPLLRHSSHRIPNLEKKIAESPEWFVFAIRCAFKRSDNVEDWRELGIKDNDHLKRTSQSIL